MVFGRRARTFQAFAREKEKYMGLNYGFVTILKKDNRQKTFDFIASYGEWEEAKDYLKLYPEVDEVIIRYLKGLQAFRWFTFKKSIDYYLTEDKRAKLSGVLFREETSPTDPDYIKFYFDAATSRLSRVFKDSPAIRQWFVSLSKAVDAEMTYADYESEGCSIMYWQGKEINISFSNEEYLFHSRGEFKDIMAFFASNTEFLEDA